MKGPVLTRQLMEMAAALVLKDDTDIKEWNVLDWLKYGAVPPEFKDYPKAIEAQEIMNSPLYKALKEENEGIN